MVSELIVFVDSETLGAQLSIYSFVILVCHGALGAVGQQAEHVRRHSIVSLHRQSREEKRAEARG